MDATVAATKMRWWKVFVPAVLVGAMLTAAAAPASALPFGAFYGPTYYYGNGNLNPPQCAGASGGANYYTSLQETSGSVTSLARSGSLCGNAFVLPVGWIGAEAVFQYWNSGINNWATFGDSGWLTNTVADSQENAPLTRSNAYVQQRVVGGHSVLMGGAWQQYLGVTASFGCCG